MPLWARVCFIVSMVLGLAVAIFGTYELVRAPTIMAGVFLVLGLGLVFTGLFFLSYYRRAAARST